MNKQCVTTCTAVGCLQSCKLWSLCEACSAFCFIQLVCLGCAAAAGWTFCNFWESVTQAQHMSIEFTDMQMLLRHLQTKIYISVPPPQKGQTSACLLQVNGVKQCRNCRGDLCSALLSKSCASIGCKSVVSTIMSTVQPPNRFDITVVMQHNSHVHCGVKCQYAMFL